MSDDKKQENDTETTTSIAEAEIEHSSAQPAEGDPDAGVHSGISSELPAEG